jgi:hypothetical protein
MTAEAMAARAALGLLLLLGGCSTNVPAREQQYNEQRARALVTEYQQARMQGDLLGLCVKSNLIAGVYEDAKDPGNASAWRARNTEDCRLARDALVPADR